MEYDLTLAQQAYELAEKWHSSASEADTSKLPFGPKDLDNFNSNQKSTQTTTVP
jgi:leukotriene-A4 hydrolase